MAGRKKLDVSHSELMTMREEGLSNQEIAERLEISPNTVWRYIGPQPKDMTAANRKAGLAETKKPEKPKKLRFSDDELRSLRASGMSDNAIAKKLGCSATTVSNRIGKRSKEEIQAERSERAKAARAAKSKQAVVKPEKPIDPDKKKHGRRLSATNEELMRMRKSGMSDSAIARELGCSPNTVVYRIGPRPPEEVKAERQERVKKMLAAKQAKETPVVATPPEPKPVTPPPAPKPPKPEKPGEMIPIDIFGLAYVPAWFEQLHDLAGMAQSEPWQFKRANPAVKNIETPILEFYLNRVYRRLALLRNATPAGADNEIIYMRGQIACFHTGLYTPLYKGIYALFKPNPRVSTQKWYFEGFFDEISSRLKAVHPLPKPLIELEPRFETYDPSKPIRVNTSHIIDSSDNLDRLPKSIREAWNLPLLLETAVELSRRRACIEPGLVLQARGPQTDTFIMPLWMTNMDTPCAAILLDDMGDYYAARTNVTPEMAYLDIRQNGRPSAKWLTDLVE